MPVERIHTYLVHPGKADGAPPQIGGTEVALEGKLFRMLDEIYGRAETECDIEISFNPRPDGTQQNPCRDLILEYVSGPTLARGRHIAERLEKVTTHRSGLGLLFLITGKEGRDHKVIISRFPADSAILAEEDQRTLSVEFLERVFMKSATAYKAALYRDPSLNAGFWLGRAVDKQINSREVHLSTYWIAEFLDSDFRITSAAGTRRLAVALREAAKKARDLDLKSEITAAVTLAKNLRGKRLSIREFEEQFGLSEAATGAIGNEVKSPDMLDQRFQFDWEEFSAQVAYRSVELNNGGVLTADSGEFDKVFHREIIDEKKHVVRYSTEGTVVDEKLGKVR